VRDQLKHAYADQPVLISGATGFLGRALIADLLQLGAHVVGLYHRQPPHLEASRLRWEKAELGSAESARELFTRVRPKFVFHLAGTRGGRGTAHARLQETLQTNLAMTHNLLEASQQSGVASFVHSGSSEEYGCVPSPFREDHGVYPVSAYGVSKLSATLLTQQYALTCGVNACSARIFLAYGPNQSQDFFVAQLLQAWRTGEAFDMSPGQQSRDFVWIQDCIQALLHLGAHPGLQGRIVNVCTGTETRLLEVVALLQQLTGSPLQVNPGALPYRSQEMMRNVGDPGLLESMTGFRPTTSLRDGLTRLLG